MEEAETTEQEQKEKGTAEHIKQMNMQKQGKRRKKGEEQEKTLDASEYTELNHRRTTRTSRQKQEFKIKMK